MDSGSRWESPFVLLPDLPPGMPAPPDCPLCGKPVVDDTDRALAELQHEDGDPPTLIILTHDEDDIDVSKLVAYRCDTGYYPVGGRPRVDYGDEAQWSQELRLHRGLPPATVLFLIALYYREHLEGVSMQWLARCALPSRVRAWTSDQVPAFSWSCPPFWLTLPTPDGPPPTSCPYCGEVHIEADDKRDYHYRCEGHYRATGSRADPRGQIPSPFRPGQFMSYIWTADSPCTQPPPTAILTVPDIYWARDRCVAEARDHVLGAWEE